jgi:mannitol-1-phosphate/altronate dehydrogenase
MLRRLSEATAGRARPEVGIVHLGAGAFHRAHQATFTEDAGGWGICAVAPRRRDAVEQLAPQDGLFTLLVRHPDEDRARVIGCLREVLHAPSEPERVVERIADPRVHVVTLTITEAGYSSPVVELLARGLASRDAPLTVLSCDNLPRNGEVLERLVGERDHVTFPCTVVDRITPAATEADREAAARLTGFEDRAAVVTEPFRQWVIEDRFAGARPAWEQVGAQLVADSAPYEQLKLRVLNGSHSMLTYLGLLAGARTVDEAVRDDAIAGAVRGLVNEDVAPTLPPELDLPGYVAALDERFGNPRLGHRLAQIAIDGSQKLPARLLPVARERLAAGAEPRWVALAIAAWVLHLRGDAVHDDGADGLREALARVTTPRDSVDAVLGAMDPELAASQVFRGLATDWLARLEGGALRAALAP